MHDFHGFDSEENMSQRYVDFVKHTESFDCEEAEGSEQELFESQKEVLSNECLLSVRKTA